MPLLMELDERRWLLSGGPSKEWAAVKWKSTSELISDLKDVERFLRMDATAIGHKEYLTGIRKFISSKSPLRNQLAGHPIFNYWLHLFKRQRRELVFQERSMLLGLFQGFVAPLDIESRKKIVFRASTDPDGRFYLYGTPYYVQIPGAAFPVEFEISVSGENSLVKLRTGERLSIPLSKNSEIIPGIYAENKNWLLTSHVMDHNAVKLGKDGEDKFISTLRSALTDVKKKDPLLWLEMRELLRVLVPLVSPSPDISVSSSYSRLPGAVALSHSDDAVLQAETLIHEYCHQKLNLLAPIDSLLLPGQSGKIFYSPWRDDPRHLRGILYGVHAFLNVVRYFRKRFDDDIEPQGKRRHLAGSTARRVFQMQDALQTLSYYGSFTEFGRRFLLGCWKELGILRQGIESYPSGILEEQKRYCANHRKAYALPGLGLHKGTPRKIVGETVRR